MINYAFGSRDHFMTFVARDEKGGSRMLRMSHFNSPRGSGWDLSTGLPPQPSDPHEYLGTTLLEGDGVQRCLFCHTTNFRAVLDEKGPEAKDLSIGCERCHGPGGHHIAAAEAGFADLAILNPGRMPVLAANKTCGQCHDLHDTSVISAPRTDPVWFRFQSLALTWSRCYIESEGNLGCMTCHDPHAHGRSTSASQDAKCLACHSADPVAKRARLLHFVRIPSPNLGGGSGRWPVSGDLRLSLAPLQEANSAKKKLGLPGRAYQGMHRVPHAERLAAIDAFPQNRSLHPRPRTDRSRPMMGYEGAWAFWSADQDRRRAARTAPIAAPTDTKR